MKFTINDLKERGWTFEKMFEGEEQISGTLDKPEWKRDVKVIGHHPSKSNMVVAGPDEETALALLVEQISVIEGLYDFRTDQDLNRIIESVNERFNALEKMTGIYRPRMKAAGFAVIIGSLFLITFHLLAYSWWALLLFPVDFIATIGAFFAVSDTTTEMIRRNIYKQQARWLEGVMQLTFDKKWRQRDGKG